MLVYFSAVPITMASSVSAVARIAYISSDVVVDTQPPLPATSAFTGSFRHLSTSLGRDGHNATVISLPFGADPGASLLQHRSAALISYTATAHSRILNRLIPHLTDLASLPLVLHIAVEDDLSDVMVLRSTIPFFVFSNTPQKAHDNALLSSLLARSERKAVLHVFSAKSEGAIDEVDTGKVTPLLLTEKTGSANGAQPTEGASTRTSDLVSGLYRSYEAAAQATSSLLNRSLRAFESYGSPEPHTVIFALGDTRFNFETKGVLFVDISLLNPLSPQQVLASIPSSATRVIVVEQLRSSATKWTPTFLDILSALQSDGRGSSLVVQSALLSNPSAIREHDVVDFVQKASQAPANSRLTLGPALAAPGAPNNLPHVPKHESAYVKLLTQVFGERLDIANSPSLVASEGELAVTPEFALGRVRGQLEARSDLVAAVQELLQQLGTSPQLHGLLTRWLRAKDDVVKSRQFGDEIVKAITSSSTPSDAAARVYALRSHFPALSRWIVGSDAWSYDLGASGLHHAIASRLDVNILILDSVPYSSRNSADPTRRKQDVGLYAMNHGDVYVASVALYSSYSQVLQALVEADKFNGPSVVLAYLPYVSDQSPALEVLKETKLAVDAGYWPLYRWNPQRELEGNDPFTLDSDSIKNELQKFLDRQNHLSQLVRSKPQLATEIVGNLGDSLKEARKQRAKKTYEELLTAIDAPPLCVLYASDGGKAEKVARRLAARGKLRGLSSSAAPMDSMSLDELEQQQFVLFVTSVAGQGEFPQNGRTLFKALNAAASRGETPLAGVQFSVFGMGDSHYWPRPEDAHYYNKSGKDLDARLETVGGQRVFDLGLGDDQDADGPETGYKVWEPLVWKFLGVDAVELQEAEPEPITNEHIKVASQYLRGTIAEGLADTSTGALDPSDTQLTKFHGIYQQDDRDIRDERQAQGVEPAFSFMIRVRMPGGVCTPDQWLLMDRIADEHGCGTSKITTRQTFQFHGVIKRHLKAAISDINRALLDTLAACGDVNR